MLENYLIDCCAPTLASLKSGSMFNCSHDNDCGSVESAVESWNESFSSFGIRMSILRMTDHSALIYVYREANLADSLRDPDIRRFLKDYGYDACLCCDACDKRSADQCSISKCLEHLKGRITACGSGFPHEIGVFLDYPLSDVKGFIENKGRNFKMVGLWKVYGDKESSIKTFNKYRHCSRVYSDLWRSGRRSVLQLTVAG